MDNNFVNVLEEIISGNTTDTKMTDKVKSESVEEKYNELHDKYLRTLAEYDNYRKRTIKEKEELVQNGHSKTIESILPIIDDFEIALNNLHDDAKEGVTLIYNKFITTLNTLGVEKINIEKNITQFDTNIHDAITMVNVDKEELNKKIIDCIQTGYTLHGKVMRHPKVIVGNYIN